MEAGHRGGDLALVLDVTNVERYRTAGDAAGSVDHLRREGRAQILVGRTRSRAAGERKDRPDAEGHRP